MTCAPSASGVVSSDELQAVVPAVGWNAAPSTLRATLATRTLSAAVPETATVPLTVAPGDGAATETLGGAVSGTRFFTLRLSDVDDVLPLESVARACNVCAPSP